MDSDGGSGTIGGGIGMAGGSRGRNELKLEAESRRKAQQRLPQAVGLPPLRVSLINLVVNSFIKSFFFLFNHVHVSSLSIRYLRMVVLL